jgi:hypothetical protein
VSVPCAKSSILIPNRRQRPKSCNELAKAATFAFGLDTPSTMFQYAFEAFWPIQVELPDLELDSIVQIDRSVHVAIRKRIITQHFAFRRLLNLVSNSTLSHSWSFKMGSARVGNYSSVKLNFLICVIQNSFLTTQNTLAAIKNDKCSGCAREKTFANKSKKLHK